MTDEILRSFEILELKPDVSFEGVRQAYREMAKVWHPDRFQNEPKLRAKAQEKLKQINLAYERLRDYFENPTAYNSDPVESEQGNEGKASSSRIPEEVIQAKFDRNSLLNSTPFGLLILAVSVLLIVIDFFLNAPL